MSADSGEGETHDVGQVASLIANMTTTERLKGLWLASTPAVAEAIVKSWPEFSAIQLHGDAAVIQIRDQVGRAKEDALFVLSVLAKNSHDPELRALGEKLQGDTPNTSSHSPEHSQSTCGT
jgi:hypothetical protein